MTDPAENDSDLEKDPPKSTLYVVTSALVAAAILGFVVFMLIRGYQWRGALAELRAEPGIEILSVERVGFFKKRLRGLRDPLAPKAEDILLKHNIGPHTSDVVLTEYHSLNTPYAKQRRENTAANLEKLRSELIESVGKFAESLRKKREQDLERITELLMEAHFPEAMKSVNLEWQDGDWLAKGELYAPQRENFVKHSPEYIIEGEIDFSELVDLTASKTSSLRADIESTNLLETNMDGEWVHTERIARLVSDYDEVCKHSNLPRPALQLESTGAENSELTAIREELLSASLDSSRFLPAGKAERKGDAAAVRLKLVVTSE